jgi:Dirigent-like protein
MIERAWLPTGLAVVAGALLVAGAGATTPSGSARAPTTLTVKELERGATFIHIRNNPRSSGRANLQGDLLVITNPLADSSGKRVGKMSMSCVTTTGASDFMKSTFTCSGLMTLPDGSLTLQGNVQPSKPATSAAVTGGTGVYANATGEVVSKQADGGAVDTITLGQ